MKYLPLAAALLSLLGGHTVAAENQAAKPNIIIILSDDHGYTDLGICGIDPNVQTPALDNLAANGALLRYGYSTAPQCVPDWKTPQAVTVKSSSANSSVAGYATFEVEGLPAMPIREVFVHVQQKQGP